MIIWKSKDSPKTNGPNPGKEIVVKRSYKNTAQ